MKNLGYLITLSGLIPILQSNQYTVLLGIMICFLGGLLYQQFKFAQKFSLLTAKIVALLRNPLSFETIYYKVKVFNNRLTPNKLHKILNYLLKNDVIIKDETKSTPKYKIKG